MSKKQRFRGLFVFVSAFFVMFTAVLSNNINNIMKAEGTFDDSPSGEKIVDIAMSIDGYAKFALTQSGEIYAWGGQANGILGNGDGVSNEYVKIPRKVYNSADRAAMDGKTYLTGVKQIYISGSGVNSFAIALMNDESVYAWGCGIEGALGTGSTVQVNAIPRKVMFDESVRIKEIFLGENNVSFLTGTGEVFATGNLSRSLGLRYYTPIKIDKDYEGNNLIDIKKVYPTNMGLFVLKSTGELLCTGDSMQCGRGKYGTGTGKLPASVLTKEGSPLKNIKDVSFVYADGRLIFRDFENKLYINAHRPGENSYYDIFPGDMILGSFIDDLAVFNQANEITESSGYRGSLFVANNKLYTIENFGTTGSSFGQADNVEMKVKRYQEGMISENFSDAKKAYSNLNGTNNMVLSNSGALYINGDKISFGDINVTGKKSNGLAYFSREKYNDSISIEPKAQNGASMDNVRYKLTDHIDSTNSVTSETNAEASYTFTIEEDKRIYRTYDFYITGKEADTKTSFTVDLYKKAFTLSDIEESKKYQKGKTIIIPGFNGFAENTVSATLTKDGETATAYTSGTAINDAGSYVINATDLYGNAVSYSFSIVDVPVPEDVTFTKSSSGELTYGNAITKTNGIVGSLSLKYAEGVTPSTIKTLTLGTGGNESNFEVVNTNQLKVKGSDLSAQEYTLNVSGTDQNDMEFTGTVKFTIAKGTQTIDFDSPSKAFGTSGKKMGDVFTLGTTNVLGGATVTYSADSCATNSSNQATITCVPASGKITFTSSAAATTNYDTKSVSLDIPVSKLDITVKTQLLESGTYKDTTKIKVGDSLPNNKVTAVTPSDFDPTKLGTPTFTYKKAGVTVANPQKTAGTYDVDVTFTSSDGYNITITKGTLVVEDIVLDDDTKDDYYTLTSGGKTYTPDTWTKDPIIITPKHTIFNKMSVDSGSVTTTAYTYQSEGSKDVTLSFSNVDDINITTTVKLKYDNTAPTMNDFTYEKPKSKLRAAFDYFFGEQKTVVFDASDTGSGVKTYDYEIFELDDSGNKITSSKKAGQGTSYTLSINKAYEINAKATDTAGNVSTVKTERVTLSDNIGKLDITAKSDGKVYDGTKWTSKAIDLTLKGTNVSGVSKYQYSEDGIVFNDITGDTISLPSPLANVNNKTYTFRAMNNDGSQNDETFSMKVDIEKPVISVKGKVNGVDYDGSEVSSDVEIILSQTKANISGITYYYTKDASAKDSNPLTDSKWTKQSGTILESTNGTHTYYVKGVSGAGLVSDVQSITVKLLKRNYTTVNVAVTTEGKAYTPDTWAKGDVTFKLSGGIADASMITGYEYAVTTGAKPTASTTWIAVTGTTLTLKENIKDQTYYFRVLPKDNLESMSKGTIVKLDIEKPSTPVITMKELNTNPIAKLVNAISFGNWMKESVEVTIASTDTISGIDYYKYSETVNGVKTDKVSKTGVITYDKDTKLTISASAVDKAGNISDLSESKEVMIDKEPPVIIGVKDQGEYKHYYLPRFIHVEDKLSGVKEASIQKNSEAVTPFTDEISVKEIGTYTIKASDNAENEITLIFKIIPLPSLDEIDGSDESKDIIDQVQKELDEIKDKIDETEKKDYEDWIKDATDKWESLRKKVVEDDEKTSKVEGVGDTNFDPKTELIVDPIEEHTLPVLPRRAKYSYDVYLKKGTTVIQPNGEVKVYLPYPDDAKPIIYEIDKDGNVREIAATKEGEYVVFTTKTLMKYAISNTEQELIDPDDKPVNPDDPNKPSNPDDPNKPDDPSKPDDPKDPDDKGEIVVPGPDGETGTDDDITANPSDKEKPTQNPDGTVTVPPGGSVTYPDGSEIETPDGGILKPDGSLTLPDGTEYDKDGNKKPKVCNLNNGTSLNVDSDGDGLPDINLDINNDCKAELNIDLNEDKIPDIDIDSNGDGKADINVDSDKDGYADLNLLKLAKWTPDKNCKVDGFAYDTMSGLIPDSGNDKNPLLPNDSNQGSNNGGNTAQGGAVNNKVSGAYTGDSTSLLGIIATLTGAFFLLVLAKKKTKKDK